MQKATNTRKANVCSFSCRNRSRRDGQRGQSSRLQVSHPGESEKIVHHGLVFSVQFMLKIGIRDRFENTGWLITPRERLGAG